MFSERLRERREKLGLSQRELNRRCGFAEHSIHHYESGRSVPSMESLKTIAVQLRVTTDYLLGMSDGDNNADLTEDELDMLEAFRRDGWPGVIRLGADRVAK